MLIIYKAIKNGRISFTKEELHNLLEQARKEGYNEGYSLGYNSRTTWITGTPDYKKEWNEIMCDGTYNTNTNTSIEIKG